MSAGRKPPSIVCLINKDRVVYDEDIDKVRGALLRELDGCLARLQQGVNLTLDYERLDGRSVTPERLTEAVESPPWGSDARLVVLEEAGVLSEAAHKVLVRFVGSPTPTTRLIMLAPRGGKLERLRAELKKVGEVREVKLGNALYEFVDRLAERKAGEALTLLRTVLMEGKHPQAILALVIKRYRQLYRVAVCQSEKKGQEEIAKSLGVQPWVAKNLIRQARGYRSGELVRAVRSLLSCDRQIKSGTEPAYALEKLVFALDARTVRAG